MIMRPAMRRSSWSSILVVVAFVFAVLPVRAKAIGPAIDFTQIGSLINNWNPNTNGFSLGWEFDVLQPITIARLGYFNYGPNGQGITTPHQVGIFDANGFLLVSATVNPGDPVQGLWAWHSLASPFTLPVGTGYRIAGLTGPTDLYTYSVPSITVDPSIIYVRNRYIRTPTGQLINPLYTTSAYPGYHFFGPNMDIVPEPALVQLPFLLGMAGLGYWKRRRTAKT